MSDSCDISIHAAREGGDHILRKVEFFCAISIHAAREGGDASCPIWLYGEKEFQSTPPVKAATVEDIADYILSEISIHAAREGGDLVTLNRVRSISDFNPRRP